MEEKKKDKKFILWFEELKIEDVPLVGGKNAALGEMYQELVPLVVLEKRKRQLVVHSEWLVAHLDARQLVGQRLKIDHQQSHPKHGLHHLLEEVGPQCVFESVATPRLEWSHPSSQ